jgi:hypothetical protein
MKRTVWIRTRESREPLIPTGAQGITSIGEALKNSAIASICVSSYNMTSYLPDMDDVVESLIEV